MRVLRFLDCYIRESAGGIVEREVEVDLVGGSTEATYIRPTHDAPAPGWIVLHGITVTGRRHPALRRFARALARSGAAVLMPDVPVWRSLALDSAAADVTIAGAGEFLRGRPDVIDDRLNLVGFSFGGTHALVSASKPAIRETVRGVLAFGAFCDLPRTIRFVLTGEHEWGGVRHRLDPDPYGRWIIIGNYLRRVPEYREMEAVASSALSLAHAAGRRGTFAGDPAFDDLKSTIRQRLPPEERGIWDLIAPPSRLRPPDGLVRDLAEKIIAAGVGEKDSLEPKRHLQDLDQRILLAHGYHDRLIPYTETLRLHGALPKRIDSRMFITRFFAHSKRGALGYLAHPVEIYRFVSLLGHALRPC